MVEPVQPVASTRTTGDHTLGMHPELKLVAEHFTAHQTSSVARKRKNRIRSAWIEAVPGHVARLLEQTIEQCHQIRVVPTTVRPGLGGVANDVDPVLSPPVVALGFRYVRHDCIVIASSALEGIQYCVSQVHEVRVAKPETEVDHRPADEQDPQRFQRRMAVSLR